MNCIHSVNAMKRWVICFVLLCCVGCQKHSPMLSKLPDDAVILAFGDSITYGTGASAEHDYPHILAQLTGRKVINAGVPGEISSEGRLRLPAVLDEYQPDLMILIHGGNDILRQIAVEQTRDNLKAMIADAKQRNVRVVLIGVPKFGLVFLHSSELYTEITETEKIPSDLETLPEILANNELKSDVIHPNDQGYQRLAENIAALLKKQGAL